MRLLIARGVLWVLVLALLTGCVGADGKQYVLLSTEDAVGLYVLGAVDSCMVGHLAQLDAAGIAYDEGDMELLQARCFRQALVQAKARFTNIPVPLKHGFPAPAKGPL